MQENLDQQPGKTVVRKNYGCERRVWKKMHHDAIKTHKTVACLDFRNIQLIERAEAINDNAIEQYGVSFDEIPTGSINLYDAISDSSLKFKVFMKIKEILKTGKNPFTGKPLNRHGITIAMMGDIIELCQYGRVVTKNVNHVGATRFKLSVKEIDTLCKMATIAGRYHPGMKFEYDELCKKVKSYGERKRELIE